MMTISSGFNAHPVPPGTTWSAWRWKMTTSEQTKTGIVMRIDSKMTIDNITLIVSNSLQYEYHSKTSEFPSISIFKKISVKKREK